MDIHKGSLISAVFPAVRTVMMNKISIDTLAPEGSVVSYFQVVSMALSCTYISQGLVHLYHGVKCTTRPGLIDFFSTCYLARHIPLRVSEKLIIPHHHYVVHLFTGPHIILADLMTFIVLMNHLLLASAIMVLSKWPSGFI